PGLNRWHWDFKRDGFTCIENITLFAGLDGPVAPPGRYTARLTVGDVTREAAFRLEPDPRRSATPEEQAKWEARLTETSALLESILARLASLRRFRDDIDGLMRTNPDLEDLQRAGRSALEDIARWDHEIIQPLHQTLEDEDAWETMLAGQVRFLLDVISYTGAPVTGGQLQRLSDLKAWWAGLESDFDRIQADHVQPLNEWALEHGIPHVGARTGSD
ncbi:MAG: hypothetical protein HKP03_02280, partial [Xanthomonadales bacterium]|nr:hypothetical protein [Xanthomonadales bacterium]